LSEPKSLTRAKPTPEAPLAGWLAIEQALANAVAQPNLPTLSAREELKGKSANRQLRIAYAAAWFFLVAAQLAFMNWLLLQVGRSRLSFDNWLFHAYLIGTFVECVGVVSIITRNLFPRRDTQGNGAKEPSRSAA
jgi:hypothetical protein